MFDVNNPYELDNQKVIDMVIGDIDMNDYPDFCDAYIEEASFEDGTPLSETELDALNEKYSGDLCELAFHQML